MSPRRLFLFSVTGSKARVGGETLFGDVRCRVTGERPPNGRHSLLILVEHMNAEELSKESLASLLFRLNCSL